DPVRIHLGDPASAPPCGPGGGPGEARARVRGARTTLDHMPRSRPRAATVVTGGSEGLGRAVALALGRRGDAVAVVYLDDQGGAEATVEEILAAGGAA